MTFRLYDWDRVDPKTGRKRDLTIEKAIACIDLAQGAIAPVVPIPEITQPPVRERMFDCQHFRMWRVQSSTPFTVGLAGAPRVLVCVDGAGEIESDGANFPMTKGAVVLLPAIVGACTFKPGRHVTLLEIAIPDQP